MNDIFLMNVL